MRYEKMRNEIKYKIIKVFEDDEKNMIYICKKTNNHNFIIIEFSDVYKHDIIINGSQRELSKVLRDTKKPLKDVENKNADKIFSMYGI
jgi:hypothetical protein